MAEFFPTRAYKAGDKTGYFPDNSLNSLGAAYRLAEGTPVGQVPKELLIAQTLREKRPDDFGANKYLFDVNSPYDKRAIKTLSDLYHMGGYNEFNTGRVPDKKDKVVIEDRDWFAEDDKTKSALQAMMVLGRKVDQHGVDLGLERWNGEGKGRGYDAPAHKRAVLEQLEALRANPQHMKQILSEFDTGYKNPEWFLKNQERVPERPKPTLEGLFGNYMQWPYSR